MIPAGILSNNSSPCGLGWRGRELAVAGFGALVGWILGTKDSVNAQIGFLGGHLRVGMSWGTLKGK